MIKNFLYSLFLHFALLLIVYANFNLKTVEENKTSEIAISLISLTGSENPNSIKADESSSEAEKKVNKKPSETLREAKSHKKSLLNKVKQQSKKPSKSKPPATIEKSNKLEKTEEFKQQEASQKQEESEKKQEQIAEATKDEDKKIANEDSLNQEFGSRKKFDQEQEASSHKDEGQTESVNLANSIENIDLSAREKFNIQSQLGRCYKRAVDESNFKTNFNVVIKVNINEEGYIDSDLEEALDVERYNDPKESSYKIAIDNVRRALDLCSPLRNLPLDKYEVWKEVVLDFNQNEDD
jgi:outer membrane biosynthesis protein TonB